MKVNRKKLCCKKCGEEVKIEGIRAPRKCEKCGEEIKLVTDCGVVVYASVSIFLAITMMWFIKMIINSEKVLFAVFALVVIIIPNLVEKVLYKCGILKYTNIVEK